MAKRMQHGFASRDGLLATLLARGGYLGIQNVYETSYGGFLSCFSQGTAFEPQTLPEKLQQGLGAVWELQDIRVKLHAAITEVHGAIDCIDKLQNENPEVFSVEVDQLIDQIDEIVTEHSRAAYESL